MLNSTSDTSESIGVVSNEVASKRSRFQNYVLIWTDRNIAHTNLNCETIITKLKTTGCEVNCCTTSTQCIELLNDSYDEKVFLIVSGVMGKRLVPKIHDMRQLDAVYIYCGNKERHKNWIHEWSKIQGVFTSIKPICESLKKLTLQCDYDSMPISFVEKDKLTALQTTSEEKKLDHLDPSYMYAELFKEIVLEIDEDGDKSIHDLIVYARSKSVPEADLTLLQTEYYEKSPIWWYSYDFFLYGMLNRALRTLDMMTMMKMGFFIRQLHQQLDQLCKEQASQYTKEFKLYRGQGLSEDDFDHLSNTLDGLISFNNFLSTSEDMRVARSFAEEAARRNPNNVGILFILNIDPTKSSSSTTPFANVAEYSAIKQEKEVLFSMHSVFRIVKIEQTSKNKRTHEVHLMLTDNNDPQLAEITRCIQKEIYGPGWYRMGELMLRMGDFSAAEELYNDMLNYVVHDLDRAQVCYQLGRVKWQQGRFEEEIPLYEEYLRVKQQYVPENDPILSNAYHNIGLAYKNLGDYTKALEFNEKSHQIKEISLPSNHPDLATSFNNIGQVYDNLGDYPKAIECYKSALKIEEEVLPPLHPNLATTYHNIGVAYSNMGRYSRASEYFHKALEIKQKVLHPEHFDLACSFSSIGSVYENLGDPSTALEYHNKALHIREKALPPDHPSLAVSYNNIAISYNNMGDYLKALEFYRKALDICENNMPSNHPDLATPYNNIGLAYNNIGDYAEALVHFKKALQIREKVLPSNHPSIEGSHRNFAICYNSMGNYEAALQSLGKALEIQKNVYPDEHAVFATTYFTYGSVYCHMKDYSKALEYCEKSTDIREKELFERHPLLALSYSATGNIHRLLGNYENALSFHQKALNIQENGISNQLECATTYVNLGETYLDMKDYSTSLNYFEKGLEIRKKKLPEDHPDQAVIYHDLAKLYLYTEQHNLAIKNAQEAVNIAMVKLASTHPMLMEYRKTLELIETKLQL